jgi:hypothetical protein
MSSKLVKHQPGLIVDPNDQVIVDLKIWKSGTVQLQAPHVHPKDLTKLLNNIITDLTYAALTPQQETPKIDNSLVQ